MCCKVLPGNDTRGCPSCLLTFGPVSVPTIDTFGCARFHPFGNGKPQKRAGPTTRERPKPWRRQAAPFPESVIHRERVPETVKQAWQAGELGARAAARTRPGRHRRWPARSKPSNEVL